MSPCSAETLSRTQDLALSLHFGGIRRNACTYSRRLITRKSQVQILPPLLEEWKSPATRRVFHLMRGRSDLTLRRGAIILHSGSPDRSWQRSLRVQGGPIPHG